MVKTSNWLKHTELFPQNGYVKITQYASIKHVSTELTMQECIPVRCVPPASLAVSGRGVCLGRCLPRRGVQDPRPLHAGIHPPREQNDRQVYKHNLRKTSFADGNNIKNCIILVKIDRHVHSLNFSKAVHSY